MPPKRRSANTNAAGPSSGGRRKSNVNETKRKQGSTSKNQTDTESGIRIHEEIQDYTDFSTLPGPGGSLSCMQNSTFLKPLKDITKSFEFDIEFTLSQLLNDFTKAQYGSSNAGSTFATAGLILASCSDKYGKKVDHLLNMALQLQKDIWDAWVKRNQTGDADNENSTESETGANDDGPSSDDESQDGTSRNGKKNSKLCKRKTKHLSTAFKEAVFLTPTPNFYEEFLPLAFTEPSKSVDMKEFSHELDNLSKPQLLSRDLEVHLDVGRSRTSNYNVIDWRQESVGKIFDFFSQTSRVESGALILFESALPARDKSIMMFGTSKQSGTLPELDIDRPIRLQSPNSYHSFVDDASSNYANSQYQNTLETSSHTGNLSRQVSEAALSIDIPTCLNSLVEKQEKTVELSPLEHTPINSCPQGSSSLTVETVSIGSPCEDQKHNSEFADSRSPEQQSIDNQVADVEKQNLDNHVGSPEKLHLENEVTDSKEPSSNVPLIEVSTPGSSAETISLPHEDNSVLPENATLALPEETFVTSRDGPEMAEPTKSDSGMGTDSSDSASDHRAISEKCSFILSSFGEDLKSALPSSKKILKHNLNVISVIIGAEQFYRKEKFLHVASRICKDYNDDDDNDDLTLAEIAKLTPKSQKRVLDVTDCPNPKKLGRFDLDDDTCSPTSECNKTNNTGTRKFDIGSGLFFSDSTSTINDTSTPQLPFECVLSHNIDKGNLSDECFSIVSYGTFPANHEDDCTLFRSKSSATAQDVSSPHSNPPISPFSYRPFSPAFVAVGILDSPANSGFSTPGLVSESELLVEDIDDRNDSENDLNQSYNAWHKLDSSFDECSDTMNFYKTVKNWESKVLPLLRKQEKLPKFDVAKTSRDLVRNLKTVPKRKCKFSEQFTSSTQLYEISRSLVACLGLASTMNIDIFPQFSGSDDFVIELKKNEENFADKDLLKLSEVTQTIPTNTKTAKTSKENFLETEEVAQVDELSKVKNMKKSKSRTKRTKKKKVIESDDDQISSDSDSDFQL